MRLSSVLIVTAMFTGAAVLSLVTASFSVRVIEESSEINVRRTLDEAQMTWAEVQADGLTVTLSGTAPTEAARFRAISTTGTVVGAARIIDSMGVTATDSIVAPRFSVEILRNDSGISIIGLIPASTDRAAILSRMEALVDDQPVTDLLETADYVPPTGWEDALGFALTALSALPRSKISVDAGQIDITAIADSAEEKAEMEKLLEARVPPALRMAMDIAAPRPVITPFTLRFVLDETGGRFDACSAQDEEAQARILEAAVQAGLTGEARCTVGMGVPTPRWAEAAELALAALAELGAGSVTFSDADITLAAVQGTSQAQFDRVVGELENALPDVFALFATLPPPQDATVEGPPEFTATLSPEGLVQLRGRLSDPALRELADSYAKARFGSASVYTAARVVEGLPADWPVRVLSGLEALSKLENGVLRVTPDNVSVQGMTHDEGANAAIAGLLSDKLGGAERFEIDVIFREPPPPTDIPPTPEECEAGLADIMTEGRITFEPGSATITASSLDTMNAIADLLDQCGDIRIEIQGHTDSQGREVMNEQLSQARAQSVLNELRARRILTTNFTAKGYGETRPIADNDTEEGREANRRIEFRLIRPEPSVPEAQKTLDEIAEDPDVSAEGTSDEQN
ncbi:OmpA family protein [Aestuariivita boseongensis]|uniref:OmpA family protein n=1 Tax=Aestuariivita boseongensis TaxID=1470562 RepID=UPI0006830D69|nr:OmpA family protein [Aestuariivita boseongensis]